MLFRSLGVFHHVVEEARGDHAGAGPDVPQQIRHRHRMADVGLTAGPHLAVVELEGEMERHVLRIQLERQNQPLFSSLREYNLSYGITKQRLDKLNKQIVIMHPGPINRGVEIDSNVADSPHSIILDQVENGVAVRMACLYLLTGRSQPA